MGIMPGFANSTPSSVGGGGDSPRVSIASTDQDKKEMWTLSISITAKHDLSQTKLHPDFNPLGYSWPSTESVWYFCMSKSHITSTLLNDIRIFLTTDYDLSCSNVIRISNTTLIWILYYWILMVAKFRFNLCSFSN